MWLAAELKLRNVDVVVLEQDSEIMKQGRGVTVHPRTLEGFEMRGMVDEVLANGHPLPGSSFAQLSTMLSYDSLDTDYRYVLTQPQARTTALIEARARALGADIRRGHRVCGFTETAETVTLTVDGPDGEYEIDGLYAVACDGTRSFLRDAAGIPFPGTKTTATTWVGDAMVDADLDDPLILHWSLEGTLIAVQIPGGARRFIGIHSEDVRPEWDGEMTFEDMRSKVERMVGTDFGMHDPTWLSSTGNSSRLAETYRKGRVFVAGDAAHRHFPLGAVGMSVSIQDTMNLGWKLAAVLGGWAPESLLDTYHDERHAVGADLLEYIQAQTALTVMFTPDGQQFRNLFAKLMGEVPGLKRSLAERTSGLHVSYSADESAHRLVGKRAPNLRLGAGERPIYELFHTGSMVLLDLHPDSPMISPEPWADWLTSATESLAESESRSEWVDVQGALIRPDGYVAWATETAHGPTRSRELQEWLSGWLGTTNPPAVDKAAV
jgi:2-polyprenyl-6-methoxyphenol hydroxylase-like FAD-dependent oxidoreductase